MSRGLTASRGDVNPQFLRTRWLLLCIFAAACASQEAPVAVEPIRLERVVPGTLGLIVAQDSAGVLVAALATDGPAAGAGIRVGDVLQRYNEVAVVDTRQFYRLMLDSAPGSTVRLELLREGVVRRIDVPVEEIDTALRV